jgi:hypothetical protein
MRRRKSVDKERMTTAAGAYLARGWKLFTVGANKRPWMNCPACPAGAHDGEQCPHPFCHGFQAATSEMSLLEDMLDRPGAHLALRTGSASGVVVVDAEGTDRVGAGRDGVAALDDWDWWGEPLRARTSGGGLHLFYAVGEDAIPSRNRVVPNIDIKADGGYVVLPPAQGRWWDNWTPLGGQAPPACAELYEWLRGGGAARAAGGKSSGLPALCERVEEDGRIYGGRYEFTRDMAYKLRKQGVSREYAEEIMGKWWNRYAQPPEVEHELPWRQVMYELDRVYVRVSPERGLSALQQKIAERLRNGS